MESRNVTFLETPPYSMPSARINEDYDNDILDLTSFLDISILDSPEKELENLRAKMRGKLQENADAFQHQETSSLPEEPASLPQEEKSQEA